MTTIRDLVTRSARLIGAIRMGEALTGQEANDALTSLNAMANSWANSELTIYARVRESFPLTSAASYTIGTGQTFNTAKPVKIVYAYTSTGGVDYPLEIISDVQYQQIPIKTIAGWPAYLNYVSGAITGTIYLYPVPSSAYTLHLLSAKALSAVTLDTVIELPAGWEDALAYNTAVRIAPEYGQKIDPYIIKLAMETLGQIKLGVARSRSLEYQQDSTPRQNIYTGWEY